VSGADRNQPCPCGSGQKAKRCCARNVVRGMHTDPRGMPALPDPVRMERDRAVSATLAQLPKPDPARVAWVQQRMLELRKGKGQR
jgi:SEC-C motif